MSRARAAYWVWRAELHAMLRAPIIYVIGGVFLVVQGVAFAGLVEALSDPRRPAPLGALLEGQLAGTLLTWVLELVVLTLLGMRAIADDRRSGAWELLLTAQVGEGAAVVGKWLAATTVYALLWIPTLAYFGVVAAFRADTGGWDGAAIACGYLGAIALGAALLAWAIAASAAMSSTLGAGALGFLFLVIVFLVGELPALWTDLAADHPTLAAALDAVAIRRAALAFARGELAAGPVVLVGGLAITGLSVALALACAGRRRRAEIRTRGLASVVVAAIAILAGVLAVRHPARLDLSANRRNTLDDQTRALLATIAPAKLTIVRPTLANLQPIYDEAANVADRMAEVAPITVQIADPARAPGGLPAIAQAAGIRANELAKGGSIVVELGGRRRVIDFYALADLQAGPAGATTVERLAVEQAIAGALAALGRSQPITACATTSHGELPLEPQPQTAADWSIVASRLRAEGMTIEDVAIVPDVPARCDVLVVAGPAVALSPPEALAVQRFVQSGRGVVVAAASRSLTAGDLAATGLEAVLASEGIGLPPAIVVDPALAVRELPGALLVAQGFADHPINLGFSRGERAMLWFQPRPLAIAGAARALVTASPESWGERDYRAKTPPEKNADDFAGPSILAAVGGAHRVVVLGSAESLSSAVLAGGASAGDLWVLHAIRFAAGATDPAVDVGKRIAARTPSQVRLVLSSGERSSIVALVVAGIPLAWAVLGGIVVGLGRRRARASERKAAR